MANNFSWSPDFNFVKSYGNATTNPVNKKNSKQQQSAVGMGYKTVIDSALTATNTTKTSPILSRQCLESDRVAETKEESGVQKSEETNAALDFYRGWADNLSIGDWSGDFDDTYYNRLCSWLVERLDPIVASDETPMYISGSAKTLLFFAKLYVGKHKKEIKQTAFDQLVGLEAPRAQMKEILQRLQKSCRSRVLTPIGVLLFGPAGTGKTTLAQALAREAEASFLPVAGKDLLMDAKGIEKLNSIFNEARDCAPSIIFIDGVEAVKVVDELMQHMDKCISDGAVVLVVATAEKVHLVDEKLMDYIPTMIEFKKPDMQIRQDMVNVIIQEQETEVPEEEKETIVKYIASEMDGFGWKQISLVCCESKMRAISRGAGVPMTLEDVHEYIKYFKRNRRLRKERAREATEEDDKIKRAKETKQIAFDQLVGLDAPRAQMKQISTRLQESHGSHVLTPTGVLLLGPAGTGKTSLAQALAREAEASFLSVAGEDLLRDEKGIGKLNSIFNDARDIAPSIIFIDGVEAVKAVKELKEQMDKCDGAIVLVVATAEKLCLVDDQLMDYMPEVIELKKPDLQARQDMANVIIQKQETQVPEGEKETLVKYIASEMDGFVWKHISLVCFESQMRARSRGDGVPMTLEDVREYIKHFKQYRSLKEEKAIEAKEEDDEMKRAKALEFLKENLDGKVLETALKNQN